MTMMRMMMMVRMMMVGRRRRAMIMLGTMTTVMILMSSSKCAPRSNSRCIARSYISKLGSPGAPQMMIQGNARAF